MFKKLSLTLAKVAISNIVLACPVSASYLQNIIDPPSYSSSQYVWLGADIATSLSLHNGNYVWLFGDTLVGNIFNKKRYVKLIISNTVGINHCELNRHECSSIKKYYQSGPRAIFILLQPHQKFWPIARQMLTEKLFVSGYSVRDNTQNINVLNSDFILVDNPTEVPTKWQYHVYPVLNSNKSLTWSTAAFSDNKMLYILGERCTVKKCDSIVSRIAVDNAERAQWFKREYWLGIKTGWRSGRNAQKIAAPIMGLPGQSELSIEHNDYFGWYSLQIPFFSHEVHLYTAKKLTGPWLDRGTIYAIPDAQPSYLYYAAKIHPELSHVNNEITFTYNSNQSANQNLFRKLQEPQFKALYIPQMVTITFHQDNTLNNFVFEVMKWTPPPIKRRRNAPK